MTTDALAPGSFMLYSDLCALFEKLYLKKKSKPDQEEILTNFFNAFRQKGSNVSDKKNATVFPLMRLLLPDCDRDRGAYDLKEKKLGDLLVKVLSLSRESKDAQKLLNYKSVQISQDSDFALVAFHVLKSRVNQESSTLTVGKINDILDEIARIGSKISALDGIFTFVMKNCNAIQMKWFLRLILKDLKLGIGVKRTLTAFHPYAHELYETRSNLSKVCEELVDGNLRPLEMGIEVFCAVRPMLSERLDVTQLQRLPQDRTYIMENKFDGERFQIHMENGVFEYFSRMGHKYGDKYGRDYNSGMLTPHLKDSFSPDITSFILDGEMMGWHQQDKYFGCKAMNYDIKKITEYSKFRPCFCVYDLLYYNGKTLVGTSENGGMTLKKRLHILDRVFHDITGVIQHSVRTEVKRSDDIVDALNKAIDNRDEGIVVKDIDSYYIANRRNAGWYKVKAEYTDSACDDLDLVIIGADEAENKRQGRAKTFHVAYVDVDQDNKPIRWISVGRVSSGLTHDENENLCVKLEKHWKSVKRVSPPSSLVFHKSKPDFWIMPEHSLVLQVRATELVRNPHYGGVYTLRFPRIERIRDDKPVDNILTLREFNNIVSDRDPVIKMNKKRIHEDQREGLIESSKKTKKVVKVDERFRTEPIENVEVISKALLGRDLCVLSDDKDCSKTELVRIIHSHSGRHVENYDDTTWCCIVGIPTVRANAVIKSKRVDVTSTSWLRSLPPSECPTDLVPLDMMSISRRTSLKLCLHYDKFGDSYTDLLDEVTLKRIFNKMDIEDHQIYLTKPEISELENELFEGGNPYAFLRQCCIYIKNEILAMQAKMYGADVFEELCSMVNYIVLPKNLPCEEINTFKRSSIAVVSEQWLEDCVCKQTLLPVTDYSL